MKYLFIVLLSSATALGGEFTLDIIVKNNDRKCANGTTKGALEKEPKKGKIESDELEVVASPRGFSGRVSFTYFHTTDGFVLPPSLYGRTAIEIKTDTSSNTVKFKFPPIRNDRFFAKALIVVVATDSKGSIAKATKEMIVSREAVIEKAQDASLNCMQVYSPVVKSGLYDNQNDTDMTITTTDGVSKVVEERKSKTVGWSIVPTIFTGGTGISLFGFNGSRLSGLAQQVNEASYIAVTTTLNPGDVGFRYTQKTRLKEAYEIYSANGCGDLKKVDNGVIYLERELMIDSFYKVSTPYDAKILEKTMQNKLFGRPTINTCSQLDSVSMPFYSEQ